MSFKLSHGRTRVPSEAVDHFTTKAAITYQPVAVASSSRATTPEPGAFSTDALCPQCGAQLPPSEVSEEAQRRITELENEVRILTGKATTAADKLADYEDELRRLKASATTGTSHTHTSPPASLKEKESEPLPPIPSPGEEGTLHIQPLQKRPSTTSRFSSFLSSKKSSVSILSTSTAATASSAAASASASVPDLASTREDDLNTALTTERALRTEAEKKVSQMNVEIEDLSSSLFQQANEMVASERKARAKLEEKAELFEKRCAMLEDRVRILEKRDAEKKRRLDALEEATKRSERIRRLLSQGQG